MLKVEYISLSEITPYTGNAKMHPADQIEQIKESIRQFGFNDPLALWNGEIVEGHGRYIAAQQLGLSEVPVIRLDGLTDEQRRAYALVHNKLTMNSDFDVQSLDAELADLPDFDAEFYGFELPEMDIDDDPHDDDFEPKIPAEPKAKVGDIYALGPHRLMCGNSADPSAWERLMDGKKADMVFTDPPYGVAIGDKYATLNTVQKAGRCTENIENDTLSESELYDLLKAAFINVRENCADDAVYFVTSPQVGSLGLMMMMMMKDAGLPVRHVLMWRKNSPTFSIGRLDYDYQHEPIFYTWTKSHHNFRGGQYRSTIWDFDKPRKCDLHPTMKPVELVANAILDGTKPGMIVLDAFCGSGTTIIAAEQTGRTAYCMELDPKYVDVIIARWESYTGKTAVLLNG